MADRDETLSGKFAALNNADLSGLQSRVDALRAQVEAEFQRNQAATAAAAAAWTLNDANADLLARKLKPKLDEMTRRSL